MLLFVFQRIWQNKWLTLSLLMGLTLATAMMAAIPIYTQGVMQNVLMQELEEYQLDRQVFPGTYLISKKFLLAGAPQDTMEAYPVYDRTIREQFPRDIGLSSVASAHRRIYKGMLTNRIEPSPRERTRAFAAIEVLEGIEDHAMVVHGRWFSVEWSPGVFEAVVTQQAMQKLAQAHDPDDLGERAFRLYERFRPQIAAGKRGWGQKGTLDLELIESLARKA